MRKIISALSLSLFLLAPSTALAAPLERYIDEPERVGEARYRVFGFNVFDADLFSSEGEFDREAPFAISLTYLRNLKGDRIVDRSLSEIEGQGVVSKEQALAWKTALGAIIPDVRKDDTITGVRTQNGTAKFYLNGDYIGEVEDTDFAERFFDIWIGEKASNKKFRSRLLGGQS